MKIKWLCPLYPRAWIYGHCGQGLGSPESVCSYLNLSIYLYASYKESLWWIKENSIAAFHVNFLL